MQSIESMIEVLEGHRAGKKIQYRWIGNEGHNSPKGGWIDYPPEGIGFKNTTPAWSFVNWEYRLKPEIKTAKPGIVLRIYKDGTTHAFIDTVFDKEKTSAIGYRHIGHFIVAEGDNF